MTIKTLPFFASTPKGMELLLADEIRSFNASDVKEANGGVEFTGDIETALRACLWSRLANRILLPLSQFTAETPEALYAAAAKIDWSEHFGIGNTFAIDATLRQSKMTHSRYAEQVIKDAIVDQFKETTNDRPSVERNQPDIRINAYVHRDKVTLSLDLSGDSLHRRKYRAESVEAPLKENLAAAILLRAGWPAIAKKGGALYDPMCGSGTFLIEAALMAGDIAPGLLREYYGFKAWKQFNPSIWERLIKEAEYRRDKGFENIPPITGSDISIKTSGIAKANIKSAGLKNYVNAYGHALNQIDPDPDWQPGLFVTNPPYGERLGDIKSLEPLYQEIGTILKARFEGWDATVFTGNPNLAFQVSLKSHKSYQLYNGALPCKVFNFTVSPERYFNTPDSGSSLYQRNPDNIKKALLPTPGPLQEGATMLANRLRKNVRKVEPWARKNNISCYRLYDADLPEYALAIDVYTEAQSGNRWVHVQEYEAPKTIDEKKSLQRLRDALAAIPDVLKIHRTHLSLKIRRRQKGSAQYEKQDTNSGFYVVIEDNCKFQVNFKDYLDTGLFLDHRITRQTLGTLAKGKRFLNLFAYTSTASVHAALGGAVSSTSVDMSNTYLDWSKKNFELNNLDQQKHTLVRANCVEWLDDAIKNLRVYDLIFIDPPTFSNSKRMSEVFDIQKDYINLIKKSSQLLARGGIIIFSTNSKKFKFNETEFENFEIENISRQTLPKDFERNPKIHYCWKLTKN